MAEVSQLVDDVITEATFDVSSAQALRWLTRRHRKMCARSRCFRKVVTLGTTVAGQINYAVPASSIDIREVLVAGIPYGPISHVNLAQGVRGFVTLSGDGGVLTVTEDTAGLEYVALYPTPTVTGSVIQIRGAFRPPDLDTADDTTLKIPGEYTDQLVAGAIATGLARIEQRPDLARPFEDDFAAGCEELRKAVNKKYRLAGPTQIRVVGVDA